MSAGKQEAVGWIDAWNLPARWPGFLFCKDSILRLVLSCSQGAGAVGKICFAKTLFCVWGGSVHRMQAVRIEASLGPGLRTGIG